MLYDILKKKWRSHEKIWKLFHLNSRLINFNQEKQQKNQATAKETYFETMDYSIFPKFSLSKKFRQLDNALYKTILSRKTNYNLSRINLNHMDISTLLLNSYFVKEKDENLNTYRSTPSAGKRHASEIFFHYSSKDDKKENNLSDFKQGLYYYNPVNEEIRHILNKNCSEELSTMLVQNELVNKTMLHIFVTSVFSRLTSKYDDRGYRFLLIEAGHIAQNINLVATAMGLSCINIGGFYEEPVNHFLEIDGTNHSTVYMILIGKPEPDKEQ